MSVLKIRDAKTIPLHDAHLIYATLVLIMALVTYEDYILRVECINEMLVSCIQLQHANVGEQSRPILFI